MELKLESVFDKPYVECNQIIIKSKIEDQLLQELTKRKVHLLAVCDPFFNRFYTLRENNEIYKEAFSGYKNAKSLKDFEQLTIYDKKIDILMEEYHIARNDFELYLKEAVSEEDVLLFRESINRIYRQFMYAVKNNKGLGYFRENIVLEPIRLKLEEFDPFAGLCKLQGINQPILIKLKENDLNLLESERGSCYFSGSVYCHPNLKKLQIEIIFESQDLNLSDKQKLRIKKRKCPLHLMEKHRIK